MHSMEYKKSKCIESMSSEYKTRFEKIVEAYGDRLSVRVIDKNSAYTLHDFDHHCFDIYKIISNQLFDSQYVYGEKGLSDKELFILNLAVLFHDFGMNEVNRDRDIHSKLSAEFVQREYDNASSTFRKESELSATELKALKAIIKAHSNIKDGTVPENENGLYSADLKDQKSNSGDESIIRTRFLAAVLRIADELDITSARLGDGNIEAELKAVNGKLSREGTAKKDKDIKLQAGLMKSLKHWRRLHLFSHLDVENNVIIANIDDEVIAQRLDESDTIESLAMEITEVISEIKIKMEEANTLVFSDRSLSQFIRVTDIEFCTSDEKLKKEITEKIAYRRLSPVVKLGSENDVTAHHEETAGEATQGEDNLGLPKVVDDELEKKLTSEVFNRNLIRFGHFRLNDKYCTRDWIDTKELVETKAILSDIVNSIVKDLNSSIQKNLLIVGIDFVGTLMASRVAFALQMPLTYIVSTKDEVWCDDHEVKPDFFDGKKPIVLITDAIVSFNTVESLLSKYNLENKEIYIYTLFFRPSKIEMKNEMIKKVRSLNNHFQVELFYKEQCIYNKNRCVAINRAFNEIDV